MIILPAIDIKGGECVRLYKGDYSTAARVADNAVETAKSFEAAGAGYIHTVDLDGALDGVKINSGIIIEIARAVSLPVEVGGGIRTLSDIEFYVENGISRVILGSAAVKDFSLVTEGVRLWGDKIAVGIDALDRTVRTVGWTEDSRLDYIEFAKRCESAGVKNIIFTDISKDGTLCGPNLEQLFELKCAVSCDITASGGIKSIDDIRALADMKLYGAICGKSVYSGTLDLKEAVALAREAK
ncbi:MAG: 1-(5-phosphoribosyl)-5-[Clostridia bacterium]|nr:1-(5-phosphoribosyl)-5-[(5-phosphoribosylamino)methylideneamino]imidazole-4-carboxamide isomerase [Clostridia bacterium]